MGPKSFGIEPEMLSLYALQIKGIHDAVVEVAVVIGGGNIFRGINAVQGGFDRVQGDYMGMLATVMNGMALQSALENLQVHTRLQTAIEMKEIG